jgi:hypothetical protein
MDPAMLKWIETQSPLWVIYALVIVAVVRIGTMILKWLPVLFEKHCLLLDTATESMSESAVAISSISSNMHAHSAGQAAIADAAVPACKAILVVTPPEKRQEVKEHLDEVVKILTKPKLSRA